MLGYYTDRRDILMGSFLTFFYTITYIPKILGPHPLVYRAWVQKNTKYVASTFAQGGIPYTPPYPDFYSTAGGHLHGLAGSPFQLLYNFSTAYRLGTLVMGICSLFLFYSILRYIDISRASAWLVTGILMIYPQYVLFHAGANPAAADIFFGLMAVYAYLRWRAEGIARWLIFSSVSSGAATFSHFYSGVVAVGIIAHYILTTKGNLKGKARPVAVYLSGLLPALSLLIAYKTVFAQSDPNSHYFDRLIINSFGTVYYTESAFGSGFSMFSVRFIHAIMEQHEGRSPIFGNWLVGLATALVLMLGTYCHDVDRNAEILLSTWVAAGSLIVILIPGGIIYHDYYTWWLLMGIMAALAWSIDGFLNKFEQKYSVFQNRWLDIA